MKHASCILWALLFSLFSSPVFAQFPSANVLQRVIALRGDQQGTGFTIEVDGRQYVVTAKHLVSGTNQVAVVEFYHDSEWKTLDVTVLRSEEADVAVLVPPQVLTPSLKVDLDQGHIFFGQDVFFLGFPYMMGTDVPADANNGFPLPFIKKGVVSAMHKGQSKYATIYVDGINNPGFSGGPLVAMDLRSKDIMIKGVVTGYRANFDRVMNDKIDTGLRSLGNSGIITCFSIQYAIDEIKKHPYGPKVPSAPSDVESQ